MHELSLTEHLLTLVARAVTEAGCSRVHRVTLGIGHLSCVDPDTLLWCITHHREGTVLQEAEIVLSRIDAEAECTHCHTSFSPTDWPSACPQCGAGQCRLTGGRDMTLESLEAS